MEMEGTYLVDAKNDYLHAKFTKLCGYCLCYFNFFLHRLWRSSTYYIYLEKKWNHPEEVGVQEMLLPWFTFSNLLVPHDNNWVLCRKCAC